MKLRTRLIVLIAGAVLPVVVLAGTVALGLVRQQREAVERGLADTVRALGAAVDNELAAVSTALQTLATSEWLEEGDLASFHGQCRRVLAVQPTWSNVLVADARGQLLMNLRVPFGTKLPNLQNQEWVARVLAGRGPVVSDLTRSARGGGPVVLVGVPAVRGKDRVVLFVSLEPRVLTALLQEQTRGTNAIASLMDGRGVFVARSWEPERYIGQRGTPIFMDHVGRHMHTIFLGTTPEGVAEYTALRPLESGWMVGLAVRREVVDGPMRRSLWGSALALAGLLTLGLALAVLAARRVANPVTELERSAGALGRGEVPQPVVTSIREVRRVSEALEDAGEMLAAERRQRDAAEVELAERTRRLEAVRVVTAEVARELDLAALLRLIVERARDLVQGGAGTILLWSDARQALVPRAWVGVGDWVGTTQVTLDQGVSGRVFTTGQGKIVNEYQRSSLALPPMLQRGHVTAVVVAPLVYRGTKLGTMAVNHVQAGRMFAPRDLETLELFAAQAAIAIENARLYTETIRRQRQAEALAALANTLTESLALEHVGEGLVHSVTALLGTPGASVRLLQPDGQLMTLASVGPAGPLLAPGEAFAPGEALAGRAAVLGVPCWTSDILEDPGVTLSPAVRDRITELGLRAVLVAPVRAKGAVIGTLTASDRPGRRFESVEVEFLQTIADQAALAIENARLHEETERRRRQAEASETRYRSLVDGSIQGMIIVRDNRILFANPSLATMLGYDGPADLVGQPTMVLVAPHEQPRIMENARRRVGGEAVPSRYEFEGVQKSGGPIWLEVLVSPTSWEGEPATQVTLIDFTERKRTAEALHQKEEQLRQSQKMEAIGQLAGGIAHDFNNLLTVIGGRLEMMMGALPDDDPMARDLTLVQRAADRAAGLTRQLLAFSRKQMLQPRIVDLNGVVAGMDGMLHRLIGEDIELVSQAGRDLWRVNADPGQIEQVILNLAVNARDAMPEGGRLTIRTTNMLLTSSDLIEARDLSPGAYVLLAVTDTGTGMDEATQARAFEPFFTTKGPGRGTGLGLSTVYGIVKQSGGDIVVRSAPRRGTTFEIYLPRAMGAIVVEETPPPSAQPGRGHETILVTEDDAGVRALVCDILRDQGYQVLAADGPDEAIRVCEAHADRIDLLLTDVVMPRMNGRMLADRLRERRPKLRVAFMSGYTDSALVTHGALELGVTMIQKPFTPGSLATRVREVLESTRGR